jgi:hypothetical protein
MGDRRRDVVRRDAGLRAVVEPASTVVRRCAYVGSNRAARCRCPDPVTMTVRMIVLYPRHDALK